MSDFVTYPRLICDPGVVLANARAIVSRCREAGIGVAGVIKGVNGLLPIAEQFVAAGCDQIATPRLEQIAAAKAHGLPGPYLLLRIPMMSEVAHVVSLCDYSLASDRRVLAALNDECVRQNKRHRVIVMADLGDLREGFWDQDELIEVCLEVESKLHQLELAGIGTNLGCYGAIRPTVANMQLLVSLAEKVEAEIGRELEIISGGATSSYLLVHQGRMPARINHLRIGEGILLARDEIIEWGFTDLDYLSMEAFQIEAEIIEIREKPSFPIGEVFINAFGEYPSFEDRGIRLRAILGIGKLDVGDIFLLHPRLQGAEIVGGSSDHTILDVTDCVEPLQVGDIISFDPDYGALLLFTAQRSVNIHYRS